MDIHEQAASTVDMVELRESVYGTAQLAGMMRDGFMAYGFTREEAVALVADWLADLRKSPE